MEFPAGNTITVIPILYHCGVFLMLTAFLFLSLEKNEEIANKNQQFLIGISDGNIKPKNSNKNSLILVLLISLIYAGLDELHQYFVPGRSCSLGDFWIDSTGILLGFLVVLAVSSKKK